MIKNRELTAEEKQTVIATAIADDKIIHFQQGDEELYLTYQNEVEILQSTYLESVKLLIENF
jgi:hypothetical protein